MTMFGHHEEPKDPTNKLVDQVMGMKQQGYTNDQIIQALQNDGFKSTQIYDAMNQADLTPATPVEGMNAPTGSAPPPEMSGPPPNMNQMPPQEPPMQQIPGGQAPADLQSHVQQSIPAEHSTEELVEAIIDEKWNELVQDINKIIDWKNRTESKITALATQVDQMRNDFDQLRQSVTGKVQEYDQNILNVGAELKAMGEVFQKILPSLTESVQKLESISDDRPSRSYSSRTPSRKKDIFATRKKRDEDEQDE